MARRITLSFLKTEQASGLILVLVAFAAIGMANSAWAERYFAFISHPLTIQVGGFRETMAVSDWVKHGLMAVFFFVVGLEIKFEILRGELSNPRRLALPILAALGGMILPALVYLLLNLGPGGAPHGWPTPVATDIAFALAALAVAGPRLSPALRTFLLTLAIADDLGAIGLIAAMFTTQVHLLALGGAASGLVLMALLGRWRNAPYLFYAALFVLVWAFTLKSGVSTSIAGVAAAMTIPLEPRRTGQAGVLHYFMDSLHPYVAFLILPLFAFTAAGFAVRGLTVHEFFSPVAMGIALGLFFGKQIGVFGAAALALGLKLARRPTGANWVELYGCALLCGVGFTLSLYMGSLAFDPQDAMIQSEIRLGVVAGSVLSALAGMAVLAWSQARRADQPA
jgi:NhaA family Na+:H+ antiporter